MWTLGRLRSSAVCCNLELFAWQPRRMPHELLYLYVYILTSRQLTDVENKNYIPS
jgi:hypothetical protein